ncbi:DNA methyltransferase [Vibrio alginolyticus]|uniref:DNA methyltransferase n=1 Tax=Vibrio alginolyticus TaxID=663 RepID=UPI002119C448|nr:DNA methyltransferase [Vibrio alginolyticus]MCQ9071306.1 class I SAM-dependent DNA methyltransferase [Vibrio alginolyticus]HCG7367791.1 class I SAM-dependent DNA methyltransferase [Vibrio parahaemolyticus]
MNSVQIEENVKGLVQKISNQSLSRDEFVYELLLAYGHRKSVVSRVKSGERNLSKTDGEVILKRHLYFKPCQTNLFVEVDEIKRSKTVETNKIRFVVVTDFNQIIAIDTKTQDTLDIELNQLPKHFDFFLPWAGMEKMVYRGENPADVKAAEKMADFFDHIKEQNYPPTATKEQLHELVVFLNRLLFCFFAEDTKIFSENQFTNLISQHTSEDGTDVASTFERLFEVLNTPAHQRGDLPQYLSRFPYVNGGLFKKDIVIPSFDAKARRMLRDSGQLDWADINPDIFGSMIQGVAAPETRSTMGMHYTSVTNIMKVIEPLFLNDFYDEFDKCKDSINKLRKLQVRLSRIKIFDPACGSGNFLIIAYKELRLLEIEILKRIRELEGESDSGALGLFDESHSSIRLEQFYGIELDDFAHEMAILSLWLVEHQMNMVFETEFGYTAPTLPLKQSGRIVAGNATRMDWELVCTKTSSDEVYVLGNPPYLGFNNQKPWHKEDLKFVFSDLKAHKYFDYILCWFEKASKYIEGEQKFAFVTTNSICQGTQVPLIWPRLLKRSLEIDFAYEDFLWTNNAKDKAGVTCTIIGVSRQKANKNKLFFTKTEQRSQKNINPYLLDAANVIVERAQKNIFGKSKISTGNVPYDGGFLILTNEEKDELLGSSPQAEQFIRQLQGSLEFIRGKTRWCIWVTDRDAAEARKIPELSERFDSVEHSRINGGKIAKNYAHVPHRWYMTNQCVESQIIIPRVSSMRREYLPTGYLESNVIISDSAQAIYDPEPHIFSLINSSLHMSWVRLLAGRLKSDFRYSAIMCFNTFPVPELSDEQKERLIESGINILAAREEYPDLSIADMYDPELMPTSLRAAHQENDALVLSLYGLKESVNEQEMLSRLMNMYEEKLSA